MREIVRLTGQKQPLQVGVPLYPFSHQTLFEKDEMNQQSSNDVSSVHPLLLPVSLLSETHIQPYISLGAEHGCFHLAGRRHGCTR